MIDGNETTWFLFECEQGKKWSTTENITLTADEIIYSVMVS